MRGLCAPVFVCFGGLVWPGLGPAADLPFFASPKKRRPKKGEPKSGALRASLRCSRRGGNSQTCPLRGLRTCEFLIPTPLRCSARPHGTSGSGLPLARAVTSLPRPSGGRAGVRGHANQASGGNVPAPAFRRHALASSAGPGGSGLRMSEGRAADKFAQTPTGPSNAVCPKRSAGTAHPARLFFAFFLLATQKKEGRPPGRGPAKPNFRRRRELARTGPSPQPSPQRGEGVKARLPKRTPAITSPASPPSKPPSPPHAVPHPATPPPAPESDPPATPAPARHGHANRWPVPGCASPWPRRQARK